jgi:hypothetical protein
MRLNCPKLNVIATLLTTTIDGGGGQGPSGNRSGSMGKNGGGGSGQCSGFGSQPGEENWSSMKGFGKKKKNGSGTTGVQD